MYKKCIADLNISLVKLSNEQCFERDRFLQHCTTLNHIKDNLTEGWICCEDYKQHIQKYDIVRIEYTKDSSEIEPVKLVIPADLQEGMLPRGDIFKEVILIWRIIAFNQSFVSSRSYTKNFKLSAVIWKENLTSPFFTSLRY